MDTKCKQCSVCKEEKSVEDFYVDKRRNAPYGKCKKCFNQAQQDKIQKDVEAGLRPPKQYTRMSEEVKEQILKLYEEGMGAYSIAKIVGHAKFSVLTFLNTLKVVRKGATYRKHKFKDEHYFDVIDSDDKAYFLGLLWADGCNYRRNDKGKQAHQIVINLQEKDGYIIKELARKIFQNDDIVSYVIKKTSEGFENRQNQFSLRIPSKHISNTLLNYGMTPRKSFDVGMPININWNSLTLRGFIRGFLDGDGSIYRNSNSSHYGVSFISSVKHIHEMNDMIESQFGKKMSVELKTEYSQLMATSKFHGNQITKSFLDWLYKDSTVCLTRKYDKYIQLKHTVESASNYNTTTVAPSTSSQKYPNACKASNTSTLEA